jgi:streptogramin lyase
MQKILRSVYHALARITEHKNSSKKMPTSALLIILALVIAASQVLEFPMKGAALPAISEYPIPTSSAYAAHITTGSDGAMWFTESGSYKIGRITTSGDITEYSVGRQMGPDEIISGPDGALWFTTNSGLIGRITTSGDVSWHQVADINDDIHQIATATDGAMWFTDSRNDTIGRFTTSGVGDAVYTIPYVAEPYGIAEGPDGAMWFTDSENSSIGRITKSGVISRFATPTGGAVPLSIVSGPDGAMWFTEGAENQVGRITLAGDITEFHINGAYIRPYGITAGPDGALWFTTNYNVNNIGRITTSGVVSEYHISTPSAFPFGLTSGPDGAMWFTEMTGNNIGRITVDQSEPEPTGLSAVTPTNNAPVLTWDTTPSATNYQIWRQDTITGSNIQVGTSTTANFTDTYVPGVYNYSIVAVNNTGVASAPSAPLQVAVTNPSVANANKITAQGQSTVVPAYGTDVLPGLTANNNTKATFDFSLGYPGGTYQVSRPLTFTFNSGGHKLFISSTSIDWLVVSGAGNSQGTFQGLASATFDNATTPNLPFSVTGIDGTQTTPTSADNFKLTVYTDSSHSTVLYSVNAHLSKGKVKIN